MTDRLAASVRREVARGAGFSDWLRYLWTYDPAHAVAAYDARIKAGFRLSRRERVRYEQFRREARTFRRRGAIGDLEQRLSVVHRVLCLQALRARMGPVPGQVPIDVAIARDMHLTVNHVRVIWTKFHKLQQRKN
jgi:hypothetical protein